MPEISAHAAAMGDGATPAAVPENDPLLMIGISELEARYLVNV